MFPMQDWRDVVCFLIEVAAWSATKAVLATAPRPPAVVPPPPPPPGGRGQLRLVPLPPCFAVSMVMDGGTLFPLTEHATLTAAMAALEKLTAQAPTSTIHVVDARTGKVLASRGA